MKYYLVTYRAYFDGEEVGAGTLIVKVTKGADLLSFDKMAEKEIASQLKSENARILITGAYKL